MTQVKRNLLGEDEKTQTNERVRTCNSRYCTDCNCPEMSKSPDKFRKRTELVRLHPSKPQHMRGEKRHIRNQ